MSIISSLTCKPKSKRYFFSVGFFLPQNVYSSPYFPFTVSKGVYTLLMIRSFPQRSGQSPGNELLMVPHRLACSWGHTPALILSQVALPSSLGTCPSVTFLYPPNPCFFPASFQKLKCLQGLGSKGMSADGFYQVMPCGQVSPVYQVCSSGKKPKIWICVWNLLIHRKFKGFKNTVN